MGFQIGHTLHSSFFRVYLGEILDALKNERRCDGFRRLLFLAIHPRQKDWHGFAVSGIQRDILGKDGKNS